MLALALSLTLLATPGPSARLVTEEPLSTEQVAALERELRIVNAHIQELKPHVPRGFAVGMALGFSFSVLLLPGIPMLIIGATSSSFGALMLLGGLLTGFGGVALVVGVMCAVLGVSAEGDQAAARAGLVEQRDALRVRLEPYQAPPPAVVPPPYVPGVQREWAVPRLVTVARF